MAVLTCVASEPGRADAEAEVQVEVQVERFFNPTYYSLPLAFCLEGNQACGKPAADIWCQSKGYDEVMSYARNRQKKPTIYRHADSKEICVDDPMCFGFDLIKCIRLPIPKPSQSHGKATDWPGP